MNSIGMDAKNRIATMAYDALLSEVYATPKPGLVDRNNNGSHADMDVALFEKSAAALRPYFFEAVGLGTAKAGMQTLRKAGVAAECEMFAATNGVNTHKGAIYGMGLLLYGMGQTLAMGGNAITHAQALVCSDLDSELLRAKRAGDTHGAALLSEYGVRGARGEAANGFPHAVLCMRRLLHYRQTSADNAEVLALCDVMASLEDTNLLHRGGTEGLLFVRSEASRISFLPESERVFALLSLDAELIRRNLSPGGSADMLALGLLLVRFDAWGGRCMETAGKDDA